MKEVFRPLRSFFSDGHLFLKAFLFYLRNLPLRLMLLLSVLVLSVDKFSSRLKFEILRRLIWSRGKRSRPAVHLGLTTMILFVLVFGGPFSGSALVLGQVETAPVDYLEAQIDVVAAQTDVLTTQSSQNRGRPEPTKYAVKSGDTLSTIGEKFRVSTDAIKYASNLSSLDTLLVGQELVIPPIGGLWHTVAEGETVSSIAEKYQVAPQAVIDSNYLFPPYNLSVAQQLVIPDAKVPAPKPMVPTLGQYASTTLRQVVSKITGEVIGSGSFSPPCSKLLLTQYFSSYHPAIDIGSVGQDNLGVYASDDGEVISVDLGGWNSGYGNRVVIDHGNGYRTTYNHLTSSLVSAGDKVAKGQQIAVMGGTGRSYGVHLHFEVEYYGRFVNPLGVL